MLNVNTCVPRIAGILFMLMLLATLNAVTYVQGACVFPSPIRGTWVRGRGAKSLTFTESEVIGLDIKYNSQDLGNFSCRARSGDTYIIASNIYSTTLEDKRYYTCWKFVEVNRLAYFLYELSDIVTDASYKGEPGIIASDTEDSSMTFSKVCSRSADGQNFTTIIKKGATYVSVSNACPRQIIAKYSYALCTNSELDFCSEPSTVIANYSKCASKVFNSESGVLSCLGSVTGDAYTYLNLVRQDTENVVTCFKYQAVNQNIITGQYYSGDCSTTAVASLTLTKTEDCSSTRSGSESQTSVISGVTVTLILLVISLLLGFLVIRKKMAPPVSVSQAAPKPATEIKENITRDNTTKLENGCDKEPANGEPLDTGKAENHA